MSFTERLTGLSQRVPETIELLQTEEATKNALVMPFLQVLGYDVFDPREVVPEFTADVGIKKGEKVDYAVKHEGEIVMLIEAKKAGAPLAVGHASQLFRYFTVTTARIAILTNGVQYQFFSDLDEPNRMDSKAFMEIDLRSPKENLVAELEKLSKSAFDLQSVLSSASDLKYMNAIRTVLERQFDEPDDDFVRFFFGHAEESSRFVQSARDQFSRLVRKALHQAVADRVNKRLRAALASSSEPESPSVANEPAQKAEPVGQEQESDTGIVTTEEELEAYRIVKAICCALVSAERIAFRDAKSYASVLLDDNNRKPICRLRFNAKQMYLGLFDSDKSETRVAINGPEDIYQHASTLKETVSRMTSSPEETE